MTAARESITQEETSQEMQDLLKGGLSYRPFHRGEIVEGKVVGLSRDGLIVDIGAKVEGIIPPQEMRSLGREEIASLPPGHKLLVFILRAEGPDEPILLSLDRARGEKGWRLLQQRLERGECFEAPVSGYNRGGLLVDVEGLQGFVPLSQLEGGRPEDTAGALASRVGQTIRLKVLELNRRRNRIILSERAAMQEWRSQQKERLLGELQEGEIRRGRITSIQEFGLFVDLGGADGLAPTSELTWDRSRPLEEVFKVGEEVDVYILRVDHENRKIALSLRRAQPGRWEEIIDRYQVGQVVIGQVTKLVDFGAFARIEGALEGLIHISELCDRRISHPKEVVREGETLPLKIVRIEKERHRLGLSLKQARAEGEAMGFVFDEAGGILEVPEEARQRLMASRGEGERAPGAEASSSPHPQEG